MNSNQIIPEIYDEPFARSKKSDEILNKFFDRILKRNKITKVWDASCGTGNQAIFLFKQGYTVFASDINKDMIQIAKKKAQGKDIQWKIGDMQNMHPGKFDAILSIYNSICYLNESELKKTFSNFYGSLGKKGIFLFDFFNKKNFAKKFPKEKFIQKVSEIQGEKQVLFNQVKYNSDNELLISNFELYSQKGLSKPNKQNFRTRQKIYSKNKIVKLLKATGFKNLKFYDSKGKIFNENKSLFVLIVATK